MEHDLVATFIQRNLRNLITGARLWSHWFCVWFRGIWGTFGIHVISRKRRTVSYCGGFQFLRCHPNFMARTGTGLERKATTSRGMKTTPRDAGCVLLTHETPGVILIVSTPPPASFNITSRDSVDSNQISFFTLRRSVSFVVPKLLFSFFPSPSSSSVPHSFFHLSTINYFLITVFILLSISLPIIYLLFSLHSFLSTFLCSLTHLLLSLISLFSFFFLFPLIYLY